MDIIRTLLKYGANPNIQDSVETGNNNPMHIAVSKNMIQTLQLFLDIDEPAPELEMKNTNGFTVLHIAAVKGYVEICKILMETGKFATIRLSHQYSFYRNGPKHPRQLRILRCILG